MKADSGVIDRPLPLTQPLSVIEISAKGAVDGPDATPFRLLPRRKGRPVYKV
jgi:hypothetical protein